MNFKKISEFFWPTRSKRDQIVIVYYRMGRRRLLLTQGLMWGVGCFIFVEAIDYFQHGRIALGGLKGWWEAFFVILGLTIWCGGGLIFALVRWRKIERRALQLSKS